MTDSKWTLDIVANNFATVDTSITGYRRDIFVDDETEYSVEVVILSEAKDGNHECAYRQCTPSVDSEWVTGTLDDVADALNDLESQMQEWADDIEMSAEWANIEAAIDDN